MLEPIGFRLTIREPWWHGHRALVTDKPRCNLHVFGFDSPEPIKHRIFRDWLRRNPGDRDRYAAAKRQAASEANAAGEHVMQYNARKQQVIREIYHRAFVGGRPAGGVSPESGCALRTTTAAAAAGTGASLNRSAFPPPGWARSEAAARTGASMKFMSALPADPQHGPARPGADPAGAPGTGAGEFPQPVPGSAGRRPGSGRMEASAARPAAVELDGDPASQPGHYEAREQGLAGTGEGMLLEDYIRLRRGA